MSAYNNATVTVAMEDEATWIQPSIVNEDRTILRGYDSFIKLKPSHNLNSSKIRYKQQKNTI